MSSQDLIQMPLISQLLGPLHPSKPHATPRKQRPSLLSHHAETQNSVTPLIYHIANRHFLRPLKCLGQPLADNLDYDITLKLAQDMVQRHSDAPCDVVISRTEAVEGPEGSRAYTSIQLNGVSYQVSALLLTDVSPTIDQRMSSVEILSW